MTSSVMTVRVRSRPPTWGSRCRTSKWDFERRARELERIVASGRGHQVLLSQDICFRDLLATNGGRGYTCLLDDFLPWLVARGPIDDATARRLVVHNPQRAPVGEPVAW